MPGPWPRCLCSEPGAAPRVGVAAARGVIHPCKRYWGQSADGPAACSSLPGQPAQALLPRFRPPGGARPPLATGHPMRLPSAPDKQGGIPAGGTPDTPCAPLLPQPHCLQTRQVAGGGPILPGLPPGLTDTGVHSPSSAMNSVSEARGTSRGSPGPFCAPSCPSQSRGGGPALQPESHSAEPGGQQQGPSRCYLLGVSGGPGRAGDGQGEGPGRAGDRQGGGPWASGVPKPLLTVFRMSEILGAEAEQNRCEHNGGGHARGEPEG